MALSAGLILGVWRGAVDTWLVGLVASPPLLTLVHELIHAAVARLLGGVVRGIRLFGGPRWHLRIGSMRVGLGVGLFQGGACHAAVPAGRWAVLRAGAFVGAPLFFHAGLLAWYVARGGPSRPLGGTDAFLLWNAYYLVLGLVPRRIDAHEGPIRTDGLTLALLLTRRGREAVREEHARGWYVLNYLRAWEAGGEEAVRVWEERVTRELAGDPEARPLLGWIRRRNARTEAELAEAIEAHVEAMGRVDRDDEDREAALGRLYGPRLRDYLLASHRLWEGKNAAAMEVLETVLRSEALPAARALLRGDLAFAHVATWPPRTDDAREPAEEAFRDLPWIPFIAGTRACIAMEDGDPSLARKILADAERRDADGSYAGTTRAWRAILDARTGRVPAARLAVDALVRGSAPAGLLERARREVAEAEASGRA